MMYSFIVGSKKISTLTLCLNKAKIRVIDNPILYSQPSSVESRYIYNVQTLDFSLQYLALKTHVQRYVHSLLIETETTSVNKYNY